MIIFLTYKLFQNFNFLKSVNVHIWYNNKLLKSGKIQTNWKIGKQSDFMQQQM